MVGEFVIIMIGATMLAISFTSRIHAVIRALSIQGLLLFVLVLDDAHAFDTINLVFLIIETLVVKAVVIPLFLQRIIVRNHIYREIEPYIPNFYSLLVASIILGGGFLLEHLSRGVTSGTKPLALGVSLAVIVTALFLIISRKKLITHVLGFLAMENGVFMLTMAVAREHTFAVNVGLLLDVFLAVFLLGLFMNRIASSYEEMSVDELSDLKD
ncbi:MAG TPA: hypothetical protein PLM00_01830 [Spirochaetota bacterium]|nr:hypothetical protein [Spirochaetota bacterium]HPN82098.1 hypothetical protein [Spirochaetota bacterium]